MRSLWIIFAFLICGEPAFAQDQFPFMSRVKSDRVYVRAGQNVNFATVAVVNKDETLVVLSKSFGWYKVKVPPQAKAYLKAEYAVLSSPEIGEVSGDKVNVRCAASTDASIIGKLERGNRFYIRAKEGDWLSIKPVDQLSGWVKEELVEPIKGAVVPPKLYPVQSPVANTPSAIPALSKFIKKITADQVETTGTLRKDDHGTYRIVKDTTVICNIVGPETVLKGFVGSTVTVLGKLIPGSGTETPVVKISKINLVL